MYADKSTRMHRSVGHSVRTFALSLTLTGPSYDSCMTHDDHDHWNSNVNFNITQYSSFPSFQTAVRLEGALYFATDESHAIRVINIDTGCIMYDLAAPVLHDDPTIFLEVSIRALAMGAVVSIAHPDIVVNIARPRNTAHSTA